MATVTLGNIKLNWKGAYNAGTAYAIDDVVSYNGSSYVAKTATTGNLPTVTANWDIMSQAGTNGTDGTDGSDGTDVGTTITTQGDLLYRNGSGLQRLGAGTAGQVLQTGGSGANPSWGTVSSDYVKLGSNYSTGINNNNAISIDGYFSSTYKNYKLFVNSRSETNWMKMRFNQSGSAQTNSWYRQTSQYSSKASGATAHSHINGWDADYLIAHSYWSAANDVGARGDFTIYDPLRTDQRCMYTYLSIEKDSNTLYQHSGGGYLNDTGAVTGITFYPNSGNMVDFGWTLYGLKA